MQPEAIALQKWRTSKMKVTIKKLSVLKHPEKNVRIHSEQQIRELKRSLEKFGQTRALVIDENNIILIGNGLYEAMVSLGYQEATVYVKAGLSENDKKKLMIADNKTYALGIDNLETLNEFLEELQGDLDIPGYDEEILQQMVADADEVTEKLSEYGTLDDSEIQKIKEANEKREQKAAVDTQSADNGESSPEKPNPQNEQPAEEQTEEPAEEEAPAENISDIMNSLQEEDDTPLPEIGDDEEDEWGEEE